MGAPVQGCDRPEARGRAVAVERRRARPTVAGPRLDRAPVGERDPRRHPSRGDRRSIRRNRAGAAGNGPGAFAITPVEGVATVIARIAGEVDFRISGFCTATDVKGAETFP
jgi:hypothetical protein